MTWAHGLEFLNNFLTTSVTSIPTILFTMETESNGHLHFLDIDIYRRLGGCLGHTVYRNPTHTNLYLNAELNHHQANKHPVLATLIHRARDICDQESIPGDL